MADNYSRRWLLQQSLIAAAIIPAIGIRSEAWGAPVPALTPADPAAGALGYTDNASSIDAKANPTYKVDQTCANCGQFRDNASDTRGACNVFPGKSVAAKGWCKVWAKRPG
jgi:hypothetical protein